MIQPRTRAMLWRWAEPAVAGLLTFLLLRAAVLAAINGAWIAVVLGALALAVGLWLRLAVIRAMVARPTTPEGPGVVTVNERRIAYMAAEGGAVLSLEELDQIDIAVWPDSIDWILRSPTGLAFAVPMRAEGADQLFEAFAALPGFSPEKLRIALNDRTSGATVIWRR